MFVVATAAGMANPLAEATERAGNLRGQGGRKDSGSDGGFGD